jgi:hypothetical protein
MATWKGANSALGSEASWVAVTGYGSARSWGWAAAPCSVLTKDPCSAFDWETLLGMTMDPRWEMRWDCQWVPHLEKRTAFYLVFD